ncbi:MAG: dihydroorotase [bacterium]
MESNENVLQLKPASCVQLTGARIVDPSVPLDTVADLTIENGRLTRIGEAEEIQGAERIDLKDKLITPGWFDLHVHFREPGKEVAETVASGCQAALGGGFTGVAMMPNTTPPLDHAGIVSWVKSRAESFPIDLQVIAAVSKGRQGKELVEMAELSEHGVRAFSDDGSPVASSWLLRHALEYAEMLGAVICEHAEDRDLAASGVMHEGAVATKLGLAGMPAVAETLGVLRALLLAEYTGARVHICHVSTAASVEWLRWAKMRGIRATAEVAPHHLLLTAEACSTFDTSMKMNPPLREEADRLACLEALADGTIDAIATDHAPHSFEEKASDFDQAPFGVIGLETALGLCFTHLCPRHLSLNALIERVSTAPRQVLRLPAVRIAVGEKADLTIIDSEAEWTVDPDDFLSKSRNTPFAGWKLKGRAVGTVSHGRYWIRTT